MLILFLIALLFSEISHDPLLSRQLVIGNDINILLNITLFMFILLPVFFFVQLAAQSKLLKDKILFLGIAILIACLFISQIVFQADDETLIAFFAYHALLNGTDPYSLSYASQLVPAMASLQEVGTFLSNGTLVAGYGYPSLYLLLQAPFFWIMHTTVPTFAVTMNLEYMVFFTIFLLSYYLVVKEKKSNLPIYSAILLAGIAFLVFSSVLVLLMLSLILLLYTTWGKKRMWLILGAMASLQQQLWIIVLLFIVMEFRKGLKEGSKLVFNVLIVFIAFNGIFIAWNPTTYIQSYTAFAHLAPDWIAPLGGILQLIGYPPLLLGAVFMAAVLFIAAFTFVWGEYRFLPLLSCFPYLFIAHCLPIYFALPFSAFALLQDRDDKNG